MTAVFRAGGSSIHVGSGTATPHGRAWRATPRGVVTSVMLPCHGDIRGLHRAVSGAVGLLPQPAVLPPLPRLGARLAACAALHVHDLRGGRGSVHLRAGVLHLCPAGAADVPALCMHWRDSQVRRFLFDGKAIEPALAAGAVAAGQLAAARQRGGLWVARHPAAAGGGVHAVAALLQLSRDTAPELILTLEPQAWGRGEAAQIGRTLLQHAFGSLGLPVVLADMNLPNPRLRGLAAALGLRIERRAAWPGLHYYFIDRRMHAPPVVAAGRGVATRWAACRP